MTLTLTIDLDNAAFENYSDEPQRIMRLAADRLDSLGTGHAPGELFTLYDVNGNTVGAVTLTSD